MKPAKAPAAQDRNAVTEYKFMRIPLLAGSIEDAKKHDIKICRGCIAEVQSGKVFVNDLPKYVAEQEARIKKIEETPFGEIAELSWGFLQYAYYAQTGECVALLP